MTAQEQSAGTFKREPAGKFSETLLLILGMGRGTFYILTGVWPLLNRRTFEAVTGPKVDFWLVQTVGVLVAVIGAVLLMAGLRRTRAPEIFLLAIGSAAGLAAVDIIFVTSGRIDPIYLLDAAAEVGLVLGWSFLRARTAAS